MLHGSKIQRAWHLQKFQRVIAAMPKGLPAPVHLCDVGCGPGSLISLLDESFSALGLDVSRPQVQWAQDHFSSSHKQFKRISPTEAVWPVADGSQDVVTLVEVIEHLKEADVCYTISEICRILKKDGYLILTTPNYFSMWPFIERVLNRVSRVGYQDQHITKFTYFNLRKKLCRLSPEFARHFEEVTVTTSHFVAPFLAALSITFSNWVSRVVYPRNWSCPFGNLCVGIFKKSF